MPVLHLCAAVAEQNYADGRDLPLLTLLSLFAGRGGARLVTLQSLLLLQLAASPAAHSSGGCFRAHYEASGERTLRQQTMAERVQIC